MNDIGLRCLQREIDFGKRLSRLTGLGTLACVAGTAFVGENYLMPSVIGMMATHYIDLEVQKRERAQNRISYNV